ncbi:MAG: hypothetical protein SW019_22320 [Actinomycetota bacterium]|nr:hypothetical protein [Actinomycetota bacterium]
MTTKTAAPAVVDLQSHPSWRAARRRAQELDEAMRRHPSYQCRAASKPVHLHSV